MKEIMDYVCNNHFIEESIINALSDFDIPTIDLNATVLEWIDLYEKNRKLYINKR